MNKQQQIRNLRKVLGSKADLFDLDARVDGRLSYEENKRIILGQAKKRGLNKSTKLTFKGSPVYFVDKAETIYNSMSKRSKAQESRATAKLTFNPRLLTYDQFMKWKRNTNRYDIIGIDSKGSYQPVRKYKKLTINQIKQLEADIL